MHVRNHTGDCQFSCLVQLFAPSWAYLVLSWLVFLSRSLVVLRAGGLDIAVPFSSNWYRYNYLWNWLLSHRRTALLSSKVVTGQLYHSLDMQMVEIFWSKKTDLSLWGSYYVLPKRRTTTGTLKVVSSLMFHFTGCGMQVEIFWG